LIPLKLPPDYIENKIDPIKNSELPDMEEKKMLKFSIKDLFLLLTLPELLTLVCGSIKIKA
jgi:hypothetical protein